MLSLPGQQQTVELRQGHPVFWSSVLHTLCRESMGQGCHSLSALGTCSAWLQNMQPIGRRDLFMWFMQQEAIALPEVMTMQCF